MNNNTKRILMTVGFIAAVAGLIWVMWYFSQPKRPDFDVTSFAQCLAEKKVTMYGAYWCSHCKNQKALFGDAFRYVPYVECTENEKLCIEKGVEGYPTWIVPTENGEQKLPGEQSFEGLSEASGCKLLPLSR